MSVLKTMGADSSHTTPMKQVQAHSYSSHRKGVRTHYTCEYKEVMSNIYDLIEGADDPSILRNNTDNVSWLHTPNVSQLPVHIVVVTDRETGSNIDIDTGSEGGSKSDIYSDIDLNSNQSVVYTKPQKSDNESPVRENVEYITPQKPIKIGTIIVEVCVISLFLILIAHIGVIEVIKTTPHHNDILKTDNDVKYRLWERHNLTSPTQDTGTGNTNMSTSSDQGGINNHTSQSGGVSGIQDDETTTKGGLNQQTPKSGMKEVFLGSNDPVLTSQNGLHLPDKMEVDPGIQNPVFTSQIGLHLPEEVGITPGSQNGLPPPEEVGITPGSQNGLPPPEEVGITPKSQNGLHPPEEVEVTPGVHHMNLVTAPNIKIVQTSTSREMWDTRVTEKTSKTTRRWIRWTIM